MLIIKLQYYPGFRGWSFCRTHPSSPQNNKDIIEQNKKKRLAVYLTSFKQVTDRLASGVGGDDRLVLTTRVAGGDRLGRCHGDGLSEADKFLGRNLPLDVVYGDVTLEGGM